MLSLSPVHQEGRESINKLAHRHSKICLHARGGYRYLSGTAETVLNQRYLLLVLCGGGLTAKLTLLGDGARWIAKFFTERLATWPSTTDSGGVSLPQEML